MWRHRGIFPITPSVSAGEAWRFGVGLPAGGSRASPTRRSCVACSPGRALVAGPAGREASHRLRHSRSRAWPVRGELLTREEELATRRLGVDSALSCGHAVCPFGGVSGRCTGRLSRRTTAPVRPPGSASSRVSRCARGRAGPRDRAARSGRGSRRSSRSGAGRRRRPDRAGRAGRAGPWGRG